MLCSTGDPTGCCPAQRVLVIRIRTYPILWCCATVDLFVQSLLDDICDAVRSLLDVLEAVVPLMVQIRFSTLSVDRIPILALFESCLVGNDQCAPF